MSNASSSKTCHAIGCSAPIKAKAIMCAAHWFMIPKPLRDKLWAELYSCPSGQATPAYLAAAKECIVSVRETENLYKEFDVVTYEGL